MKKHAFTSRKTLTCALFAAAFAFAGSQAMAEPGSQQQYGQPESAAKKSFDDQTLKKFALSNIDLAKIQNDFARKLEGAENQEEAVAMQQAMQKKMVSAVQSNGLSVEDFNSIANQMASDEQMKAKVEKMMEQQRN